MPFDPEMFGSAMAEVVRGIIAPLLARIDALEAREPIKGIDGKDGHDGRDGVDGKDCDMDAVMARVGELVKAIPTPKDGAPGKDGTNGVDGAPGRDGVDGKNVSIDDVKAILDARSAQWELDFERRANEKLDRAIDRIPTPKDGKDGRDGADGKDAAPIETMEVEQDERNVTFILGAKRFTVNLDTILDRGVWRVGAYQKGDAVSYDNSLWIAQADTEDAPGTSKAWRLAVRKGKDGRDLRDSASAHDKTKGVTI